MIQDTETTGIVECETPTFKMINIGNYLLVNVKSSRCQGTMYKYAAIVMKKNVKEREMEVNGIKSMDCNHSTFKFIDNDRFNIKVDDVVAILPEPQVTTMRGRTKYQFAFSVDVQEAC